MSEYTNISHTFSPIYDDNSEILILGSLPSVKSREEGFYYGHPRNRFWKVIAAICGCEEPATIDAKKYMLIQNHIAVWDVIDSCDIKGSSDSSIKNVIPADIKGLIEKTNIQKIYANGKTAEKLYRKYILPLTGMEVTGLPSTSPANAAMTLDNLIQLWNNEIIMNGGFNMS